MSSTTKTYLNSEYLHLSSTHSYDSSQSPLALLAQTCSSIGKDNSLSPSSISNSTPPIITSLVRKSSSSNTSNLDKSFSSINSHINKNSTPSTSSSFIDPNLLLNYSPPLFDLTRLFLRSSLPYLSTQQQHHSYSTICRIPECLQCQTVRYFISNSLNNQFYFCHRKTCNAKFSSNEELLEHIRYNHRSKKTSNYHRFHPYLKPSNDHLPYFYPHLSLSSMTQTTRHLNKNKDRNN